MTGAEEPDPSWSQYPCTVLEVHADRLIEVDLRQTVSPALAGHLRNLGLGSRWSVVTAYNPHGRDHDEDGNLARHRRLEETVRQRGFPFLRADGRSPDASHREIGLAIGIPQPEAISLAARFGQSAIFWFDGDAFWLVSAAAPAGPARLPLERPD